MSAPGPVNITVCNTCRQPWETHVKSSRRRAQAEFDDLIDYIAGLDERGAVVEPVISHLDCVRALQDANRGPMGYTGPMGPAGLDAPGLTPSPR